MRRGQAHEADGPHHGHRGRAEDHARAGRAEPPAAGPHPERGGGGVAQGEHVETGPDQPGQRDGHRHRGAHGGHLLVAGLGQRSPAPQEQPGGVLVVHDQERGGHRRAPQRDAHAGEDHAHRRGLLAPADDQHHEARPPARRRGRRRPVGARPRARPTPPPPPRPGSPPRSRRGWTTRPGGCGWRSGTAPPRCPARRPPPAPPACAAGGCRSARRGPGPRSARRAGPRPRSQPHRGPAGGQVGDGQHRQDDGAPRQGAPTRPGACRRGAPAVPGGARDVALAPS